MKNKKEIIAGVIDMGFKFVGLALTFAVGLFVLALMFILLSEVAIQIRYMTDHKSLGAVCVWGANGLGLIAIGLLAYLIFEESKMIIEDFNEGKRDWYKDNWITRTEKSPAEITAMIDSVHPPTLPVPVYGNCVNHQIFGGIDMPVSTVTIPVNTFYVSGTITQS